MSGYYSGENPSKLQKLMTKKNKEDNYVSIKGTNVGANSDMTHHNNSYVNESETNRNKNKIQKKVPSK